MRFAPLRLMALLYRKYPVAATNYRATSGCSGIFRASERDLLLSTVTKVGKSTGRNLRFLHFRARYGAYRIVSTYHTFTQDFLFRFVKRIVSASAPLPLIPATNSAFGSTVDNVSGNGARRKSMRHTLRYQPCSVNARYNITNLQGI